MKTSIGETQFEWGKKTYVMGVINMTPDSFSGDGLSNNVEEALKQALTMQEQGADIIDVGGESTRPAGKPYGEGAIKVSAKEELERVIPVITSLKKELPIPISIDTYKSEVAKEAIQAGASLINDVWGLKKDKEIALVAAQTNTPLIITHNQEGYEYSNLLEDITKQLQEAIEIAKDSGVPSENIIVDPGIGFGKTPEHNLEILRRLKEFKSELQSPVLIGTSRKSFIGHVLGDLPTQDRLEGTAATIAIAIANGADIVRVHDVKEMARVSRMTDAIVRQDN